MSCQQYCNTRLPVAPVILLLILVANASSSAADRIVLRSLKIISDRTVVSFDEDAIVLDNQQKLGWHEIEKATVSPAQQLAFDKQLKELGEALYRIRQRLTTADYEGLLQPAESLYPRYVTLTGDTSYLVKQSVMWGRIAAGRREESVEPYLRCWELLTARKAAAAALPGDRRLQFDPVTGLTSELPPVWFNAEAAKMALPAVKRRILEMPIPRPEGAYIYYATMAIAASDMEETTRALGAIKSNKPPVAELLTIIEAQQEVVAGKPGVSIAKLELLAKRMTPENQPLAWYWIGMSKLRDTAAEVRQTGLLQLARIPALAGRQQPELAGAALYQIMQSLSAQGDASGGVSVRRELLERYGQTYYALRVRGARGTEKKP
jgi:hypothetical protein